MLDQKEEKGIDIFKSNNAVGEVVERDLEMDKIEEEILRLTDNGENPGGLFLDKELADPTQAIIDTFGGKVIETTPIVPESVPMPLSSLLDEEDADLHREKLVAAAEELLADGKSIIVIGKDKCPIGPWKEFQSRLMTIDELHQKLEQNPDAQIGMVTGKLSGIDVLDVEVAFGDYKKLGLPETTVSRTGSGGYHLYYAHVEGVRNGAKIKDKEGKKQEIDVRGEGGYAVIPPSICNNGPYEWINRVADLPGFPVEIINKEIPEKREDGTTKPRLGYSVNDYPGYGEGERNDQMTKYIGLLLAKINDPELWEELAWPKVIAANEKNNPPLSETELRISFNSIAKTEEPKSLEKFRERIAKSEKEERMAMIDSIEGDKIVRLSEAADIIRSFNPRTYPTGFAGFDNAMKGGFKDGDIVIVTGMSGHGKTTLGQTFSYNFITNNIPLFWFSYEVSADVLDDKFQTMGLKKGYDIFSPEIVETGDMIWVKKKILEAIKEFGVNIFFIDLIDFITPENRKTSDSEALVLRRVMTELKDLARKHKIIIFVMAHVSKQKDRKKGLENQDIAHSSSIVQLSDYVFIIERCILGKKLEGKETIKDKDSGREIKTRDAIEYGKISKIRLTKNRYTGILISVTCELKEDERLHPDVSSIKNIELDKKEPDKRSDWMNK